MCWGHSAGLEVVRKGDLTVVGDIGWGSGWEAGRVVKLESGGIGGGGGGVGGTAPPLRKPRSSGDVLPRGLSGAPENHRHVSNIVYECFSLPGAVGEVHFVELFHLWRGNISARFIP